MIPVTRCHAAVLAAIHAEAFPAAEAWREAAFAAQCDLPGVFGLIAEPGGFILARQIQDEAEILTFAVLPACRRAGLGAALLAAAMREAASRGAAAMFLEVAASNQPASALYDRLGYRRVGSRRDYYGAGADALVMRAELAPCG